MIVSVPDSAQKLFPGVVFSGDKSKNTIYLTFDDGPVPEVTAPILDLLKKHMAIATFFAVGENVHRYPQLHQRILNEGHQIANHTYNHLSGWKTNKEDYLKNIEKAADLIDSRFFRPPYGRISPSQLTALKKANYKVIYWNILSKDYDKTVTPEECTKNVLNHLQNGSIILMHDSIKAKNNVQESLPTILDEIKNRGFKFGRIDQI